MPRDFNFWRREIPNAQKCLRYFHSLETCFLATKSLDTQTFSLPILVPYSSLSLVSFLSHLLPTFLSIHPKASESFCHIPSFSFPFQSPSGVRTHHSSSQNFAKDVENLYAPPNFFVTAAGQGMVQLQVHYWLMGVQLFKVRLFMSWYTGLLPTYLAIPWPSFLPSICSSLPISPYLPKNTGSLSMGVELLASDCPPLTASGQPDLGIDWRRAFSASLSLWFSLVGISLD